MEQLFQFAFLQSLGKAITASFWQMGLLFLLYVLIVFSCRVSQSAVKNFLSTFFAIFGFCWFVYTLLLHWSNSSNPISTLVIEPSNFTLSSTISFTSENSWHTFSNWIEYKLHFILPYLSIAYLFVLGWFAFKLFIQLKITNQLRTKGISTVSDDIHLFFQQLALSMGIQRKLQLLISNRIDIPATIGYLKPIVLIPAAALTHLSAAQLEAVLLHELAHIQRNDYFWNLLLTITETMLFFNPFALLLIASSKRERENSCDDLVMLHQQNATVYAEALLMVEKARIQHLQLVMALGSEKNLLKHRVQRILNLPREKNKFSTPLLVLIFVTILFALMGWAINDRIQPISKRNAIPESQFNFKRSLIEIKVDSITNQKKAIISLNNSQEKLQLELENNFQEKDLLVWNDANGKTFKFDQVIINDLPTTWVEQMLPRYPLPLHERMMIPTEDFEYFKQHQDSFQIQQFKREKDIAFYQLLQEEQNMIHTPLNRGPLHVREWQQRMNDSTHPIAENYFTEPFKVFEQMPERMREMQMPQFNFEWMQEQAAADLINQKRMNQRIKIVSRKAKDAKQNADQMKERYPKAPAFAYLFEVPALEEMRMNEQNLQFFIEQKNSRDRQIQLSITDSVKQQERPSPKRMVRRLEVIRL